MRKRARGGLAAVGIVGEVDDVRGGRKRHGSDAVVPAWSRGRGRRSGRRRISRTSRRGAGTTMATAKRGRRRRARRPFLQIGRGGKVDLGERGEVSGVEWGGGDWGDRGGGGRRLIPSQRRRRRGGRGQPAPVATRSREQGEGRDRQGGPAGLASCPMGQKPRGFSPFPFLITFLFIDFPFYFLFHLAY